MRVVFMGTPDFAVDSLAALCDAGFDVAAVYTQPDRPRNRGMKLACSPVKTYALSKGLPVYQPEKMNAAETLAQFQALKPDIAAVVAYGRLLPEPMLQVPPLGCVNVHASLLPKYRGSAPVQWAVLNGDRETGVCTMYLDKEMDTGDIIDTVRTEICEYETFGQLYDRLKVLGAKLLVESFRRIERGEIRRTPQNEAEASYAPPITKALCPIDWSQSPEQILAKIRGLNPKPAASAELGGQVFKIHMAARTEQRTALAPGRLVSCSRAGIEVACGAGKTLLITELQPQNGKRMRAGDYLLGHTLTD